MRPLLVSKHHVSLAVMILVFMGALLLGVMCTDLRPLSLLAVPQPVVWWGIPIMVM